MFWTDPTTIEPLRQHRWLLSNGVVWVWAKSVKPPSHTIETQKYQIGNHKLNYPGLLEWQDVTVTIVDLTGPKEKVSNSQQLYNQLIINRIVDKNTTNNLKNIAVGCRIKYFLDKDY